MKLQEQRTKIIDGKKGRDVGKRFQLTELHTLQKAGFSLRLVAALRVESYETLLAKFAARPNAQAAAPIDDIMRTLQGCDPAAVESLIYEVLATVDVAVDPAHPGAFRKATAEDVGELATLGDIIMAFFALNLSEKA